MKKFLGLTVLAALAFGSVAAAQTVTESPDKYIELLRSDLRADRVAIITEAMDFTEAESKAFWPIYREYENEMMKLGDKDVALIKDYAANYTTMTGDKAMDLMKNSLENEEDSIKLRKKYLDKFAKVLPGTKAAKFFQIDRSLDRLIDLQVASEIPLFE